MSEIKINNNAASGINMGGSVANSNRSIQMIFAEMQMELSKTNKENATAIIGEIKNQQAKSKEYALLINGMRTMSNDIDNKRLPTMPTDPKKIKEELEAGQKITPEQLKEAKQMQVDIEAYRKAIREGKNSDLPTTQEGIEAYRQKYGKAQWMQALRVREYCIKNGIEIGPKMTEKKLDEILANVNKVAKYDSTYMNALKVYDGLNKHGIKLEANPSSKFINDQMKSMQSLQDTCGSDIQQKMIYVQDYIGQYNSYMQGANAAINTSNQTLTALARGS